MHGSPTLASLHVRFKIHDGYDSADEDLRKPSEKLTAEKLEMLDSAVIDPNDELTTAQKEQVRQLLARRIDAFALNPKSPSHTHLVEVELPLNPGAVPHVESKVAHEVNKPRRDEPAACTVANISLTTG
eukprot:scaffold14933_cov101-Isochrysis_galbana.AAC.1